MKLEALEKKSAGARELARNLERKTQKADQAAQTAKSKARQIKGKLKQIKREAKLARQAAKKAKRAFTAAQRALEKAATQAALMEEKVRKTRQKAQKAAAGNGEPNVKPRTPSRPKPVASKRPKFAAAKSLNRPAPVSRHVRPATLIARTPAPATAALAAAAKSGARTEPVATSRESRIPGPREREKNFAAASTGAGTPGSVAGNEGSQAGSNT